MQDKYIVFKLEDWDRSLEGTGLDKNWMRECVIPDAHVFRDQDAFTPTVLFAYAHALRNTAEILARMGAAVSADEIDRLNNMADDFISAAERAEAANYRKLPD